MAALDTHLFIRRLTEPTPSDQIQGIDLFCGGGGATEGMILGGVNVKLAVDCWNEALELHLLNHPDIPILNMELGGDVKIFCLILLKYLDPNKRLHIHGSPPCQNLSRANPRGDRQEGMRLIHWFFDLIVEMRRYFPELSWTMENVVGTGKYLDMLDRDDVGSWSWTTLNAADYGTPQARRRVFAGSGWIEPPRTHISRKQFEKLGVSDLPLWVGVIDALPQLESEATHIKGYSNTRPIHKDGKWSGANRKVHPSEVCRDLEEVSFCLGGRPLGLWLDSGRGNAPTCGVNPRTGKKEGGSGRLRKSIEEPSYTITSSPSRIVDDDWNKVRNITIEEAAVLMGYPNLQIPEKFRSTTKWKIVGNMVAPLVMKAVIEGVKNHASLE
jgi:site-specific DNA-cytosine methylase